MKSNTTLELLSSLLFLWLFIQYEASNNYIHVQIASYTNGSHESQLSLTDLPLFGHTLKLPSFFGEFSVTSCTHTHTHTHVIRGANIENSGTKYIFL